MVLEMIVNPVTLRSSEHRHSAPASDDLDTAFTQGIISGSTWFAAELEGFRLTSQQNEGDNEVRLGVELTDKTGQTTAHTLRLVQEDNQWFPVMHVWLNDPHSIHAALDVPPKFQQSKP